MKWTYSIKNKMTAALLLSLVLVLTLLNNLVERNRFKQLDKSFSSIYEDRLLVEGYIFHLYENLKKEQDLLDAVNGKEMALRTREELTTFAIDRNLLLTKYAQTYLTPEEESAFNHLKTTLEQINLLETEIAGKQVDLAQLISAHHKITDEALETLSTLADIQTAEGAALRHKSERLILGSVSFSHFEMVLLIVLAVMIQALVLSSKSLLTSRQQNPGLN